jgi:membrane protein YdbS with pleckstrin-like domain
MMPGLTPLEPGQLNVLRVHSAILASLAAVVIAAGDLLLLDEIGLRHGIVAVPAALLLGAWALLSPPRRYRCWGYRLGEDELQLAYGLWLRVRTVVPFTRVQHIDLAQGPIERSFGVARLILHTAGTRSGAITLPGLATADAERFRDLIRSQIREDPA